MDLTLTCGLPRRVHLLGIGGAGVSGAARILLSRGHQLSGHDRAESELLRALGSQVEVSIGESKAGDLPGDAALVVRSAAVPLDDPQVKRALEKGVPVIKYAELLARLAPRNAGLAVAGTHGKTTTTWMLWHVLDGLSRAGFGASPGALVGGLLYQEGGPTNAIGGSPEGLFAMEACEYDRSFLELNPFGAIVTNVEADHLDYYGDLEAIEVAFAQFVGQASRDGLVVCGAQVAESVAHSANGELWRLGHELTIDDEGPVDGRRRFALRGPGWATGPVHLGVPGQYNVENAALALALGIGLAARDVARSEWPILIAAAVQGVSAFVGAGRRFEKWGDLNNGGREVAVVHDYAHHPTELRALLGAAREAYPGREIHLLFQPHQASRTARFMADFVQALTGEGGVDRLVVAPVYGARMHIDGEHAAGSQALRDGVLSSGGLAVASSTLDRAVADFTGGLRRSKQALALVVGAGDIEDVREALLEQLSAQQVELA